MLNIIRKLFKKPVTVEDYVQKELETNKRYIKQGYRYIKNNNL